MRTRTAVHDQRRSTVLTPPERSAVLGHIRGLTGRETAEVYGLSPEAARARLDRARLRYGALNSAQLALIMAARGEIPEEILAEVLGTAAA